MCPKHARNPEQKVGGRHGSAYGRVLKIWWQVCQSTNGFRADVKVGDSGEIGDASQGMIFVFTLSYAKVKFPHFRVIDSTVYHCKQNAVPAIEFVVV